MKLKLSLLIVCLMILSCKGGEKTSQSDEKPVPVRLFKVQKEKINTTIDIFGRFSPENQVMVFSKIPGRVKKIYVKDGDSIQKDQLLAEVIQEIPGQEFAAFKVVSPIDGTVLRNNIETGMSVTPQTVLFDVGSLRCLIFRGQVFGSDRNKVKTGQIVHLYDTDNKNNLSLVINKISPVVDAITGGLTIEAEICFVDNRPVFAGQTINGNIVIESSEEILIPPLSLVTLNKRGTGVFTIDKESCAHFNKVTVIQKSENRIAVKGLNEGDFIVTEGSGFISDGTKVLVID
ncbi:MAG: hypothetical protein A2015_03375 [Spirochaetes bacterium GWF1_31_7]|nr:MAG: hypothetical protein A2Y30_07460 [Spirochaetes bacterium GWE1_32_154]OHD48422.1 MAG: hypothetical protein A2Y29_05335 [Spirochaetes bacterium GWE2_31_10]OHD50898.1 MAG: hypothetical protein A2015_03375 [Spirochaetes bacterium GWF1_31_7]HBD92737.1 hypothetical protein [Spirochaetia bacterium]HBI38252.1 hypothetical protein [Spirochaetia bacterium]